MAEPLTFCGMRVVLNADMPRDQIDLVAPDGKVTRIINIGRDNAAAHRAGRIEALQAALRLFQSFGCPVCHGDCASANPPVMHCPMISAREALAAEAEKEGA